MQIQYFVSAQDIRNLRHAMETVNYGDTSQSYYFDEFITGSILISEMDHGGNALFFKNISLIEFFDQLQGFLSKHKKVSQATGQLMDVNQIFSLTVMKNKNALILTGVFSNEKQIVQLDYAKFLNLLRFIMRSFWLDVIYFCPELLKQPELDHIIREFNIDVSTLKSA